MWQLFGEVGTNHPAFKKVLHSSVPPAVQMDTYVQRLFSQLWQPDRVTEIPARSTQEYLAGWQKARESMALSMSGIHFGHYMVGTFNPDIILFNATMANLPMQMGYSP